MIAKDILTLMFLVSGVSCLLLGLPVGAEADGISFIASRFVLLSSAGIFFLLSLYSSQRKE
ncbi:hypothetical protein [Vibrio sp. SCSIO 43137]|uniref:hypothetical protein n=1 Tax=Vibrio sp. SCSIO 43137 TaxID=3021011 RepID=UPI0023071908|nr:hypothetical protein [Vibrio sp. SCSIO 43137]WCE28829.1 hypothetical protein PK654_10710 [Vibrio sp. SCSIO 43137]